MIEMFSGLKLYSLTKLRAIALVGEFDFSQSFVERLNQPLLDAKRDSLEVFMYLCLQLQSKTRFACHASQLLRRASNTGSRLRENGQM